MAEPSNVDTECKLLAEFVDDAGGAKVHTPTVDEETAAAVREVVRRVAAKTVPRFKIAEVVERVVAATGTEIEDLVRQQIQVVFQEHHSPTSIASK